MEFSPAARASIGSVSDLAMIFGSLPRLMLWRDEAVDDGDTRAA